MENNDGYEFGGEQIQNFVIKVSHEAKLKELLRNLTSVEVKLCSDASKEFIKLLKGENGGELLQEYIKTSSKCTELLAAWKIRYCKPGFSYVMLLIAAILSHPDGKYNARTKEGNSTSMALDKFARLIFEEKLGEIYKELNSKEVKNKSSALRLLASIVRRGAVLASDVANIFDFKLPNFSKLAEYKKRNQVKKNSNHNSTRKSFIEFVMSFLQVGRPGLLRGVIKQKEMFSNILRGLGNDDDDVIDLVLSTLLERILTPESLLPPALRSVLFGSVTLEQLLLISGRENGGIAAQKAYNVLFIVCTDPCNGLMPDSNRTSNPLKGNKKRLLDLMKKLKATDIGYHRDLLLEIVSGRPLFGSAYLDEFPYNLEDHASLNWSAAVSLASKLISAIDTSASFEFLDTHPQDQLLINDPDIQSIIRCICPRPFTRLVINKGLLNSNSVIKHGTLKLVLTTLKLLDSFINFTSKTSHSNLKNEILNEVRVLLPDPQVLLSLLSSLNNRGKIPYSNLKRPADSDAGLEGDMRIATKKLKTQIENEDNDIVIGGITEDSGFVLDEDLSKDETGFSDGVDHIAVIWDVDQFLLEDEEMFYYAKLLDTLKLYHQSMPNVLEGSFDFFKILTSNPLSLPVILQKSLLSMLVHHIGWSSARQIPSRIQIYRHLHSFITLLICSPIREVREEAYILARAAILSTGAFDNSEKEISAWFLFLPCYNGNLDYDDRVSVDYFNKFSPVVSFLCDAVSTVGNNLFKYWDLLRSHVGNLKGSKDLIPSFSPLVLVVLEKCKRILESESGNLSLPEKSIVSLYVSNTLTYILQTQVEPGLLSSLLSSVLSEKLDVQLSVTETSSELCEWRPLKNLLSFAKSILDDKLCIVSSNDEEIELTTDSSFSNSLDTVKTVVSSGSNDDLSRIASSFSFSMICTEPKEILRHCPSVISISQRLEGAPLSVVFSILFHERCFLNKLFKLWPDMLVCGLEKVLVEVNIEETEEDFTRKLENDSSESVSSAFCLFLKRVPFYVLFPASINTEFSHLVGHGKLQDLLIEKISKGKKDELISSLSLVLFWVHKVQLSYADKNIDSLEKISGMCVVLFETILSKIFAENLHLETSQEVAEIVFSHPSVMILLESPLSGNGNFSNENFGEPLENFILMAKQRLNKIDGDILNILSTTLSNISHCCKTTKGFKSLVEKIFTILRRRLNGWVEKETSLLSLIPTLVALHSVINFLSPFDLFEFASWIFSKFGSSKNSALHIGLRFASCALDLLLKDFGNYNSALFENILSHLAKIVSNFDLAVADLCLLKAIHVTKTVQKNGPQFCLAFSRLIVSIPMEEIVTKCCLKPSLTSAKLLLNLVELNPIYLSVFGRILSDSMNNKETSDDHFVMLLPTALSYITSLRVKFGERFYLKNLTRINSFYFKILSRGFSNWKSFVSSDIFQVESNVLPSSSEEFINLFNETLLGKAVMMFGYDIVSCGLTVKKRLKLFDSVCPCSDTDDDLLDCDFSEIDDYSSNRSLNLIIKAATKIYVCKTLLFDGDAKENDSRYRFLDMLVRTWHLIVKRFPLNSNMLFRFLEILILRIILDLTNETSNSLANQKNLPCIEQLARSSLLYRFDDDLTVRMLRNVLSVSKGKFSPNLVLQLLLAHSQFVPIILPSKMSLKSPFGMIFKPMSSILRSSVLYSSNKKNSNEEDNLKLEVVKLLRVLFHFRDPDDTVINSRELLVLLLSSYNATLSEIDLEIYHLMHEIEKLKSVKIAEFDYLWGGFAIDNVRREREKDCGSDEGVEERRRNQFRENFPIDPRICANTVLYFPYDRTKKGRMISEHTRDEVSTTQIEMRQIYDPVFILRLSSHCLSFGYIGPMEFASLGLLAVAFASFSSPDFKVRKLAYNAVVQFHNALETSKRRKDVTRLRLLLAYLRNGIEEDKQRIPCISSVFVSEASFILLDSSHDHHSSINKLLFSTPRINLKHIPLLHEFFWSNSITFKADRLWILRLLYAGLNSDDDAYIYFNDSVLEILLCFYTSTLSDDDSKELILQIVRKSVKLHKISKHLVEQCCLTSWLSSIVSSFHGRQFQDKRSFTHFTVLLEVIRDVISSRQIVEWLEKYGLEQLTELSSQLFKLLPDKICLREENVGLVLEILTSTLQISQKRHTFQPHLTLSIHASYHIFQAVDSISNGGHKHQCAESALKAVLMTSPSADILSMNHEKLLKLVMWAISIAVSSMQDEDKEEDSLASKLLRWLSASVFLARKSNFDHLNSTSGIQANSDSESLQSFLGNTTMEIDGKIKEIIGGAILYLQQRLLFGANCGLLLRSSVSALCLLSDSNLLNGAGNSMVASLLSRIKSPDDPSWIWSYNQAFEENTSSDIEKMDEIHACQTLLLQFSNLLDKEQVNNNLLQESSSVFQWERNLLLETNL